MKDITFLILVLLLVTVPIYQGYLFLFADCQKVKANWLLVQTPARCIK